jgi:hypothetical protein
MPAATRGMCRPAPSVQFGDVVDHAAEPLEAWAEGTELALGLAKAPLEAPHGLEDADESVRLNRRRDRDDAEEAATHLVRRFTDSPHRHGSVLAWRVLHSTPACVGRRRRELPLRCEGEPFSLRPACACTIGHSRAREWPALSYCSLVSIPDATCLTPGIS